MRILMVSMFSNHFFNWTEQLRQSGHEIYWIDVFDSNTYVEKIDFVHQIIGWRNRWDYPGRYWVKNNLPKLNEIINNFNQRKLEDLVSAKIEEIRPDVVQSFVLFSAAFPILSVMERYQDIKWIYSAWGNDLFFMKNFPEELKKIQITLPAIDYMFADCNRDAKLAEALGFKGGYLGTFPGGGGYELKSWEKFRRPFKVRKTILIKGYQGMLGRAHYVIKAISSMKDELKSYQIVIFGCDYELKKSIQEEGLMNWTNLEVSYKITHEEVMKLMGKTKLYIGNCISDGMPNTLLEAIVMGGFPIQSNPGGATAEIIQNAKNGYLIEDVENYKEIRDLIGKALKNNEFLENAVDYNNQYIRPKLEREYIKKLVLEKYGQVEAQLIK